MSSPKEATSPKGRGPPSAKIEFCRAFAGIGPEAFSEFLASPYGGFTTAAYLSGPAPADARAQQGERVRRAALIKAYRARNYPSIPPFFTRLVYDGV